MTRFALTSAAVTHLSIISLLVVSIFTMMTTANAQPPQKGDLLWANKLDTQQAISSGAGAGGIVDLPDNSAAIELDSADAKAGASRKFTLPVDKLRGNFVVVSVDVKAENVSAKPNSWNGVKAMMKIDTTTGTQWPQPDIPVGSFDWTRYSMRILIPTDATAAALNLGLENVTGKAWFRDARITFLRSSALSPPAPANQPIFRGHKVPRLRGTMIQTSLSEQDLKVLADDWGANLVRWQLTRPNHSGEETDFTAYDKWLDDELVKLDRGLRWAKSLGVMVVVDLHSPPGGKASSGGYQAAMGGIFTDPRAQSKFIEVWRMIAKRYKGNKTIWGFDLVNEPVDSDTAENCDDWQSLAFRAGKAIRAIDPSRTLIVEPPSWGSPQGFIGFHPIPLPHIVYSFHMYEPIQFTHQGVFSPSAPVTYPGMIAGVMWDKATQEKAMAPAIEFAKRYRVQMYVGEFSAIRWAPGAYKYLSDLIDIFESHGWDWTYHAYREWGGWSVELGNQKDDLTPTKEPTRRKLVLLKWMKQDKRAR
jgi:hypothetical protein